MGLKGEGPLVASFAGGLFLCLFSCCLVAHLGCLLCVQVAQGLAKHQESSAAFATALLTTTQEAAQGLAGELKRGGAVRWEGAQ